MVRKIKTFLQEARYELRHVNWPTRKEAMRLTGVVIFLSLAIAVFLGAFDYLFGWALQFFILQ
jgi:preprotein translocase subunit SecE